MSIAISQSRVKKCIIYNTDYWCFYFLNRRTCCISARYITALKFSAIVASDSIILRKHGEHSTSLVHNATRGHQSLGIFDRGSHARGATHPGMCPSRVITPLKEGQPLLSAGGGDLGCQCLCEFMIFSGTDPLCRHGWMTSPESYVSSCHKDPAKSW